VLTWLVFFSGLLVFLELRGAVHSFSGIQPHTADLQILERTLFFGVLPSQFLQELFFDPGSLGPLDCFATAVNWSYFVVPYAVVFFSWVAEPRGTYRVVHPLVLTLLISVLICAILPATPPWLASTQPGLSQVHAIMHSAGAQFDAAIHLRMYQSVGDPNPTACLPSVHFAVTFVLFLYALDRRRIWAILGGAYSAAMLFSLVYLGEHYVVDTILGGMVATGAWYTCRMVERSRLVETVRARFEARPLSDSRTPQIDIVGKG
jgi:membrane-associated phospholipid phosphatase